MKRKTGVLKGAVLFLMIVWSVIQLAPMLFLLINSVKEDGAYFSNSLSFPNAETFTLRGVKAAWSGVTKDVMAAHAEHVTPIYVSIKNSMIILVCSSLIMALASLMMAYSIARVRFKAHKFYQTFVLVMICVPMQACLLPLYQLYSFLGLLNKPIALSPLYAAFSIPLATLIMKGNMEAIPYAIDEAAEIDGCTPLRKFFGVILPLMKGSVTTVVVVELNSYWSEMMFSSLFLQKSAAKAISQTVLAMANALQSAYSPSALFSGMLIMITPLLLLYFFFQKQIYAGMTLGAVK